SPRALKSWRCELPSRPFRQRRRGRARVSCGRPSAEEGITMTSVIRLVRHLSYLLQWPPRRQTCKDCWRNDGIDFHVPPEIWNAVVAPIGWPAWWDWGGVLCLECFDRRAEKRGIDYSGGLAVM